MLTSSNGVKKLIHMETLVTDSTFGPVAHVVERMGRAFLVVCEHASKRIPAEFADLGLAPGLLSSHIAWDPGALGLAKALAEALDAPLVHGGVSRLIYDCNRPPEAPDAIPEVSEIHKIPGNCGLSRTARQARINEVYQPFHERLAEAIRACRPAVLVTIHSFTPTYRGLARAVELGILHGIDPRFALAMMENEPEGSRYNIRLNEPYGPEDKVAHILDRHGVGNGLLNVMIEVRNDLLTTPDQQRTVAELLSPWIMRTQAAVDAGEGA